MPGKCLFSDLWLKNELYYEWLCKSTDKRKARCKVCSKDFDVANMGESALKAHMKGQKHQCLTQQQNKSSGVLKSFLQKPIECSPSNASIYATSSNAINMIQEPDLTSYLGGNKTLRAEILWALKCVESNYSYNSCNGIDKLFKSMFCDSEIAKTFSCGPAKCAYLCCFGIAPYLKQMLLKSLKSIQEYCIFFYETLNSTIQLKQMDLMIRFWHPELNIVVSRYLNSSFMGHSTAVDLHKSFNDMLQNIDLSKVLQLSMDGPNVNWSLFEKLQSEHKREFQHQMLNIGTCGLHTLHNAFRKGISASNWDIEDFLQSLYFLFHNSPARKEDYLSCSSTKQVALQFCNHRWLENVAPAQRALSIFNDVKTYVSKVEKGIFKRPSCKSFKQVVLGIKDKLMPVKLNFFIAIARIIEPFLSFYQSDKPLLPFLATDITNVVKNCVTNFNILKTEEVKNIESAYKLIQYDFTKENILSDSSKISLGFVADKLLKEIISEKIISKLDGNNVKLEARRFILSLIDKILEKSPIAYSLVRHLICLDPREIARDNEACGKKMKKILAYLVKCGHLEEEKCDGILLNFKAFMRELPASETAYFNQSKDNERLDTFYYKNMYLKNYLEIWPIIKKLLILSHGQAVLESGFSVNKQLEVENLKERSYISLRQIKDHIKFCGGIENIQISNDLLTSASNARKRYRQYLEEEKKSTHETSKKRKLNEEFESLKKKKIELEKDATSLLKSADELSEKAELTRNISYCSQSNVLRKRAKEKENEIKEIIVQIEERSKEIKNA